MSTTKSTEPGPPVDDAHAADPPAAGLPTGPPADPSPALTGPSDLQLGAEIVVYAIADGPVHVGDGTPLTRPEHRTVTTSPLIKALIDGRSIGVVQGRADAPAAPPAGQRRRRTPAKEKS